MHTTLPGRDDLDALLTAEVRPWVSLFMPTHRHGADGQQDPIRLKNLAREAEERLVALGLRSPDARALVAPVARLVGDDLFWRDQGDGLGLYCAPSFFRAYRMPARDESLLVVGRRPCVRPLLSAMADSHPFFILALSKRAVRLFRAAGHHVSEVAVHGMPHGFDEAMQYDEVARPRQLRRAPAGAGTRGRGDGAAQFRGAGLEHEAGKDELLRHFQLIDHSLRPVLHGQRAPLVLAAVDYLIPLFVEASTYPHLLPRGVEGNPDAASGEELQRRALPFAQAYLRAEEGRGRERLLDLAGTGRVSRDLREILPAAANGRVDALWSEHGRCAWGRVDDPVRPFVAHERQEPGDDDLVDVAATETIRHAGAVYEVDASRLPGGSPLAALFRY